MNPSGRRSGPYLVVLLIALVAIGAAIYLMAVDRHRRVSVEGLPLEERQELFESTLRGYRRLCTGESEATFSDYCSEQRRLLRLFPECDAACRELVASTEPGPTK